LPKTLDFTVTRDTSGYSVALVVGDERATAPLQFDHRPDTRIGKVICDLASGSVTANNLRDVGTHLFVGLVNGTIEPLFGRARDDYEQSARAIQDPDALVIRLAVPAELQHLPWEMLYDERRKGFLLTDPRYSLVRTVPEVTTPPFDAPRAAPLRMLAIIPEGSSLDVEKELQALRGALASLGDGIRLEALTGFVTPDAVRTRLDERSWDIVHFIGHGDVADGVARIRLNDPGRNPEGQWLPGETFATFFARHVPRLVVLNSCHGLSPVPGAALSGIAPFLVRQSVPAIIAMQYEIPDTVAISFARALYDELFGPRARGRIDLAVAEARRVVYQNANNPAHSFVMPVLYRADGFDVLFEPLTAGHQPPAPLPPPRVLTLPDELIAAVRARKCVPVISPEILRVGATRGTLPPLGPRELARCIAEKMQYPRMGEFDEAGPVAFPAEWPLQSVCQHYDLPNSRYKLLETIYLAYQGVQAPPGVEAIAALDVPGLICTYFDGLIEDALVARRTRFRSILGLTTAVPMSASDDTVVVHLRGSVKQPQTLVLSEADHETLLDGIREMCSDITDLTRKTIGRSLLYVGLHPRDLLVRKLTLALRGAPEMQSRTAQGPLFFAYAGDTAPYESYWSRYNVTWLRMSTEDLVSALSRLATQGVGP
jgi:hypothetical protein